MRLTVSLEGNGEGRVLSSVDMEEIVKMTITDDIQKSNFNPQMLKSCTDTSYQCGYQQGRADGIEEFAHALKETFNNEFPSNYHCTKPYFTLDNVRVLVDLVAKEQKNV